MHHQLVGSARDRICFSESAKDAFKRKYLFDCTVMPTEDSNALLGWLKASASPTRLKPLVKPASDSKDMNVLLLSCYYSPALSVAIHRVRYWEQPLGTIAKRRDEGSNIGTQVMCATESILNDEANLVVPDRGEVGANDIETKTLKTRLAVARVNWTAVLWMEHIQQWFEQNPNAHFDAMVISGNPVFYFGLTGFFKERFGAQVILDFRDPLSSNPRFTYRSEHKAIVEELEDEYLEKSDVSLTVNAANRFGYGQSTRQDWFRMGLMKESWILSRRLISVGIQKRPNSSILVNSMGVERPHHWWPVLILKNIIFCALDGSLRQMTILMIILSWNGSASWSVATTCRTAKARMRA